MNYRVEKDTLGEIDVPEKKLWGAHTHSGRWSIS